MMEVEPGSTVIGNEFNTVLGEWNSETKMRMVEEGIIR